MIWRLHEGLGVPGGGVNSDIEAGGYRPLRLEAAPFHAPGAIVLIIQQMAILFGETPSSSC